nr:MAG TPA: hypothetical protein [Caudoviricetes sp.]
MKSGSARACGLKYGLPNVFRAQVAVRLHVGPVD